ncbi:metallophosphoesterase [Flocculibacter collagenilyticus]|uniref:metallophosphoesterase n=1 Tax=Flocculibacter collagenilyticus TaxID=2744479 RepID=UPI0018F570BF|nr:metallophosphoesterase [Flocculibacter collagenilyticus]
MKHAYNAVGLVLFINLLMSISAAAQSINTNPFNDGPYILIEGDKFISKSIENGKVIVQRSEQTFPTDFAAEATYYQGVTHIAAISDIHGQHDIFLNILKNNKVINQQHQWIYGDGHLVITGDIFDRGPQVLDSLWFVFNLEQQAKAAGGKVHFLLGNHEYMVLRGRLDYLHPNYHQTATLLNTDYKALFNEQTVLGRWLRSKATVIKINDTVFLHGGISTKLLSSQLDLHDINQHFRASIGLSKTAVKQHPIYSQLHASSGPIWYRGYFDAGLTNTVVDQILSILKASRIVVGHTSGEEIKQLNDGRIFAVDTSIKNGEDGEILLFNNQSAYRGTYTGEKIKLL